MMPNKRNPDPAELIRGRTARVDGHLMAVLTLLKGLPGGYQRDLQEDKPPLFDALRVLESSLRVMTGVVATLNVDEARMRAAATTGYTTATAVADALVELRRALPRGAPRRGLTGGPRGGAGIELTGLADAEIGAILAASSDAVAAVLAADAAVPDRSALRRSWTVLWRGRTSSVARRPGACTPSCGGGRAARHQG